MSLPTDTIALQRVEGLAIAILSSLLFVELGYSWWWLAALFLLFDLSMVGYLSGRAVGAYLYNAVHSYLVPALVGVIAIITGESWAVFTTLVWAFHIGVDRAFGYGLKSVAGFHETHLGRVGKTPA